MEKHLATKLSLKNVLPPALCLAALAAAAVVPSRPGPDASRFIGVDEIRPGMKGYGLTVFSGSEPERFEVEVIDVVRNALPRQDMVLVMCKGHNLEKTRVIAGMSGSPVFIEGRMAGAVAYGWTFAQDAIAGITPIANMAELMKARPQNLQVSASPPVAPASTSFSRATAMTPIATPLLVSGFSASGIEQLARDLSAYHLVPMAGGGGSTTLDPAAIAKLSPGDAVGASLISGDFSVTAIGTLTWREGDKVVAFGHPFLEAGPVTVPLVRAKIHAVIATQSVSFKMGSPEATVGRLVWDQQAGVAGELGRESPMIPFKLTVRRPSTADERVYNFSLAAFPAIAPLLVRACMAEAIKATAPAVDPVSVRVSGKYWVSDRGPIAYSDLYAVPRGSFDNSFLDPIVFLVKNPYQELNLERAEVEVTVDENLSAALIESVALDRDEARPGETVEVKVTLRPYRRPPVDYRFSFKAPERSGLTQLTLSVAGGNQTEPEAAAPKRVEDMERFIAAVQPGNRLVLSYRLPGTGVDINGSRLPNLPPSVAAVMQPANANAAEAAGEPRVIQAQDTPYVLIGAQRITLKIREPE